jgi:hypothetical protein
MTCADLERNSVDSLHVGRVRLFVCNQEYFFEERGIIRRQLQTKFAKLAIAVHGRTDLGQTEIYLRPVPRLRRACAEHRLNCRLFVISRRTTDGSNISPRRRDHCGSANFILARHKASVVRQVK